MLTKQTVVETDTHTLVWRVDDLSDSENIVPVDVTGATVTFKVKKRKSSEPTITLAGSVKDGPEGLIQHTLTGTLTRGEYDVQAVLTKAGQQSTAPTLKMGTLVVNPAL
jgi:hypothetical protein